MNVTSANLHRFLMPGQQFQTAAGHKKETGMSGLGDPSSSMNGQEFVGTPRHQGSYQQEWNFKTNHSSFLQLIYSLLKINVWKSWEHSSECSHFHQVYNIKKCLACVAAMYMRSQTNFFLLLFIGKVQSNVAVHRRAKIHSKKYFSCISLACVAAVLIRSRINFFSAALHW